MKNKMDASINNTLKSNMRSSNQKTRTIKDQQPLTDNRMMKTANQTRNQNLGKTSYNQPSSKKKICKQPVEKKEFNIEDNMTASRINQAQQGLQLLKKKMVARGMSRDKPMHKDMDQIRTKAVSIRDKDDIQNINMNGTKNYPPLSRTKKPSELGQTSTQQPKEQPLQKNKINIDQNMEAPIKAKKDFNALLQEELRKQGIFEKITEPKLIQKVSNTPNEQQGEEELIKCREGCGRMFNSKAIEKHQKICQKVFQSKRKAFDSASHRAPEVEGFNKPPQIPNKQKTCKNLGKTIKQQKQKMPKWKAQSLAFRAGLKQGNGEKLTQQQQVAINSGPENQFVQCKHCSRKFNETAATRHIPFCESKSKQLPKKRR